MAGHLMIISSAIGEKIAFRNKPDCPKRECQRLLNIYMPKNAKLNKMNHFICVRLVTKCVGQLYSCSGDFMVISCHVYRQ